MKFKTPHIITEGTSQYQLGEIKEDKILYDFKKTFFYSNQKERLALFLTKIKKVYPQ